MRRYPHSFHLLWCFLLVSTMEAQADHYSDCYDLIHADFQQTKPPDTEPSEKEMTPASYIEQQKRFGEHTLTIRICKDYSPIDPRLRQHSLEVFSLDKDQSAKVHLRKVLDDSPLEVPATWRAQFPNALHFASCNDTVYWYDMDSISCSLHAFWIENGQYKTYTSQANFSGDTSCHSHQELRKIRDRAKDSPHLAESIFLLKKFVEFCDARHSASLCRHKSHKMRADGSQPIWVPNKEYQWLQNDLAYYFLKADDKPNCLKTLATIGDPKQSAKLAKAVDYNRKSCSAK